MNQRVALDIALASKSRALRGEPVRLPPVVEGLLVDVVADGFVLYCCGHRTGPNALVASYQWEHCIDLITIRDFDWVTVARVPTPHRGQVDVFAPEVVMWARQGPPQWALRALLNLAHPAHPEAPSTISPAPPSLHIPRTEQRPLTIRPPSPVRAGVRATRLAAALPAGSSQGDQTPTTSCSSEMLRNGLSVLNTPAKRGINHGQARPDSRRR